VAAAPFAYGFTSQQPPQKTIVYFINLTKIKGNTAMALPAETGGSIFAEKWL